jgi:DNA polymerase
LYIEFGAKMYGVEYDDVTKAQRQIAKPAVLSCGYGSGGGEIKVDKNGDEYKSGLWGYAESMGVAMTQDEAQEAVDIYRQSYPEIPRFWYRIEDVVHNLVEKSVRRGVIFDKVAFQLLPDKLLRVVLPSGRCLHYLKPKISHRGYITYDTEIAGHNRDRRHMYGSLLTENLVQAIARDVMAVGMVRAADAGFAIVGHTHDELLTLAPLDSHHNLTYLNNMMVDEISWCRDLPLKSEGWMGRVYRK